MTVLSWDHTETEAKWQKVWRQTKLNSSDLSRAKKPFYNLMMFPYPSAEGLHVGNMYAFTGADVYGRFKRMQGYDVFEPIGLDGFGIHSENHALKTGKHPMDHATVTQKNYYTQLHKIGAMFDWDRTVETYDPDYYRWTQWIFIQMFKHGLAYRRKASVNWCPSDKTVLADEQVIEGKCERCGNIVEKRLLEQWFFRITAYAEKLLHNLRSLDWSEKIKVAQTNWIGKSEGINFTHKVKGMNIYFEVYDSVPQTFLAQTFVVIAPDHPLVEKLVKGTAYEKPVMEFVEKIKRKKLTKSFNVEKETEGIFTGRYSENYMGTGSDLPIWVASFVLVDYGTGIVGCSAHDERDFIFAKKYSLPLKVVMLPEDANESKKVRNFEICYHHAPEGVIQEPAPLKGLKWIDAREPIITYIEQKGFGKKVANYHLRDWLISRQRYWGPPIPMIYCKKCAEGKKGERADMPGWYTVGAEDLPVLLPRIEDYKPGNDGVAPLAKHKEFYETQCPGCGGNAVRETDVSDTFLDSSWYFLRYPSVGLDGNDSSLLRGPRKNGVARSSESTISGHHPWDPAITKKWLPVAMYTGGAEHSVLHLMYSRFVWMALRDWGYLDFSGRAGLASGWDEPFTRFYAHGLVIKDGAKMSKSKGNIVNPDEYIRLYGSDALRLYLMFMGPFDQGGDFRDTAMEGMSRWVGRVWRIAQTSLVKQSKSSSATITSALHKAIKRVGDDIEKRRYNTAIAGMMEFTNLVGESGGYLGIPELKQFILILAPFIPHLTEELWQSVHGYKDFKLSQSVHVQPWPSFDPKKIVDADATIAVQVNGKLRDTFTVATSVAFIQKDIETEAKSRENVKKYLSGKAIRKVIIVPGKLINFVV